MTGDQVPPPGGSVLDHVAYFAPDLAAAEQAMGQLGFALTPFTVQQNEEDGRLVPAGTGNRLAVLRAGYLEVLSPTGEDTAIARQFHAAVARHPGIHLITLGERDAGAAHARLAAGGFDPLPVVHLTRRVDAPSGPATARFDVVRVPPGRMPEGRVQVCRHHTPELVWQHRWLAHPNGASALLGTLVVAADPAEAADRFGRFTGVAPRESGPATWQLPLASGSITIVSPDRAPAAVDGVTVPSVPSIAAVAVAVDDLAGARAWWDRHGVEVGSAGNGVATVTAAGALGAALVACAPGVPAPWAA